MARDDDAPAEQHEAEQQAVERQVAAQRAAEQQAPSIEFEPQVADQRAAEQQAPSIECACGLVRIRLNSKEVLWRCECCCHDCSAALWYAAKRGGPAPPKHQCVDSLWFANDITILSGEAAIATFKNFPRGDTTRFVCRQCWTVLMSDHPCYFHMCLMTQLNALPSFRGLRGVDLPPPVGRHQLQDVPADEADALPPFAGPQGNITWSHTPRRMSDQWAHWAAWERMLLSGATGPMNLQRLAEQCGPPFVPSDELDRMRGGPTTVMGSDPRAPD